MSDPPILENPETIDIVRNLVYTLREIRTQGREFPKLFKENSDRLSDILTSDFYWTGAYEGNLLDLLLSWILIANHTDGIDEIIDQEDESIQTAFKNIQDHLQEAGLFEDEIEPKYLFGLTNALFKNVQCLEIFACSINYLVREVKNGNDSALFKAVRIDHSIVSNPTIADRITRAELIKDKYFFKRLSNAVRARPAKQTACYSDLRYTLAALDEMNLLDNLTPTDAYQLFSVEFGLFPKRGEQSKRNLAKFIERWKKGRATRRNDFMSATV